MFNSLKKVALVFGTRPEAIKMAPIYLALKREHVPAVVVVTGQHKEMLHQVTELFGISADHDLQVMTDRQSLSNLTAKMTGSLEKIFDGEDIGFTCVQGDTTSAFIAALVSFYHKIPVGHVEAGLRTDNLYDPYPEEANRRLISVLSNYHYAPTITALENLIKEGHPGHQIVVTGNTVIDALQWIVNNRKDDLSLKRERLGINGREYILMTMHRRENWGKPMRDVARAVSDIVGKYPDVRVVFPVHLNPVVRETVFSELGENPRVILTQPMDYLEFVAAMEGARFLMTDSGGIQEEAPALGKPTLVLRRTTERPEAIAAGTAKLVGTERSTVVAEVSRLLDSEDYYSKMSRASNPFGDGQAAIRIVNHILEVVFSR
ncbi:MAG: UDP-N-acetylglucosamine 2-epimerase [Thermotogales bacterium 46_20]|nr:MAG: UDP-N-acetylglucosamine 2-epimerase [Thermotogales bacterium 46_20]